VRRTIGSPEATESFGLPTIQRVRTSLRLASLVIAGLITAAACSAASVGDDEQDACRIGAVSLEDYQIIAAEVAAMPPIDWEKALEADRQADGVAAAIRERLEQVLADRTSTDERVAAMHAVMRSIGAEFGRASRGSTGVIYRYRLDVNRIGLTRLLSRWAEIVIMMEIQPDPDSIAELTRVVVLMPEMLDPGRPGWKKPSQERPCPALPLDVPTPQDRIQEQEHRS
jgi:hypothetical protein